MHKKYAILLAATRKRMDGIGNFKNLHIALKFLIFAEICRKIFKKYTILLANLIVVQIFHIHNFA